MCFFFVSDLKWMNFQVVRGVGYIYPFVAWISSLQRL